jgi:hypothetical protein
MSSTFSCLLAILIVSTGWAKNIKQSATPDQHALDLDFLPENVAAYVGENATFTCWVDTATGSPRIQWFEYVYNPNGGLISDGDLISPTHPHAARYSLVRVNQRQYDLHIMNLLRSDGGTYTCVDTNAVGLTKQRHSAELIVIAGTQNCTTTIPTPPLAAVEGVYYSHECETYFQGNILPFMRWQGPEPFGQGISRTPGIVWNGMAFYASRTMHNLFWTSHRNFTDDFLPVPGDSATNVPTHNEDYDSVRIVVNWAPANMYSNPVNPMDIYEVGDVIECVADAFPSAQYEWHNTRTGERFLNSIFVIPMTWLGTEQAMRCIATNVINGLPYVNEHFKTVNVPTPTTTPEPTTPTTTTTPPPVSNCFDLSGRWESRGPTPALLCLEVDTSQGNVHGVLRNATDTFWLDVVGQADHPSYDHASWTAIWPLNRAVTSFIGECSRCDGQEILLVNAISRSKGGPPCATPGEIRYTEQYEFVRSAVPTCPPITIPT